MFSKLNLCNTYQLVQIREGEKTAFNTPLGHFEYLVKPSRLNNAPAVFQSLINDVLQDTLNHFIFVWMISLSSPVSPRSMSSMSVRSCSAS